MKFLKMPFLLLLILTTGSVSFACYTESEGVAIIKLMQEKKDSKRWKKYAQFLTKVNHCLDAADGQAVVGISEDALADDWDGFVEYLNSNKPSEVVMRNIKIGFSVEMGSLEKLKKIQKNAKTKCPKKIKHFCEDISKTKL